MQIDTSTSQLYTPLRKKINNQNNQNINMILIKKYITPIQLEFNISKHNLDDQISQLLIHSKTYNACGYNKINDEFWGKNIDKSICIHYFTIRVHYLSENVSSLELRTYITPTCSQKNDTIIFPNIIVSIQQTSHQNQSHVYLH